MTSTDLPGDARRTFEAAFGVASAALVRSPGRVNLIGEHTDYSLLPVLPMAIERAIYVAAGPTADRVVTARTSAHEGEERLVRSGGGPAHGWARYLAGALRELEDIAPERGANLIIVSDLPAASGLSSSSALTLGIIAALTVAWGLPLDREDLTARAIRAERHAGVESGGMDQTVIAFAQAGAALRIDFDPPGRRPVPIPKALRFVVANSGETAPKGGAARDAYNERVVGARLAAAMLADQVGLDIPLHPILRDVVDVEVIDLLVENLPEKISAQEVAHGSDADISGLVQLSAETWNARAKIPVKRLARHILGEARRVDDAETALLAGDFPAFGKLLDASHDSLRNDFKCSTPALDRVCAAMRRAGAFGSRLTGAGFGGFAMAAVSPEKLDAVLAAAEASTGGPAFEVTPSAGLELL